MSSENRIFNTYGLLGRNIWLLLKQNGVMTVAELAKSLPSGHQYVQAAHRHRIASTLSRMTQARDVYRVGRGQYKALLYHDKRPELAPFKDQLSKYIEERGSVQFNQIVAAFEERSPKAVRSALDRLRAEDVIFKDGKMWNWMGNVVNLAKRRKQDRRKK